MNKHDFYPLVAECFKSNGYTYYDGDKDIRGKGRSHACKPDYIATKGNTIIIGEIKSPNEPPISSSWRQIQNSDTEDFKKVRLEVANREKAGEVSREVGGHEIIIRGQISDYIAKIYITYNLPPSVPVNGYIKCGYSVPTSETTNVELAVKNCNIDSFKKLDISNGSTTYIITAQVESFLFIKKPHHTSGSVSA